MQLAAWLDVALEGGVRELERARADYRSLFSLLGGDWRIDARQVSALAERIRGAHRQVDAAVERARRRARVDPAAESGALLADRVDAERKALGAVLERLRDEAAEFGPQLDWLCEVAQEQSQFASSRALLSLERNAWTAFFLGLGVAIPCSAWFVASEGGTLHTVFSADGLESPEVWGSFAALLIGLVISWMRLASWGWLGVPMPRLLQPGVVSVVTGVLAALAVISFGLRTPVPVAVAFTASIAIAVWQVLLAFWRLPGVPES